MRESNAELFGTLTIIESDWNTDWSPFMRDGRNEKVLPVWELNPGLQYFVDPQESRQASSTTRGRYSGFSRKPCPATFDLKYLVTRVLVFHLASVIFREKHMDSNLWRLLS